MPFSPKRVAFLIAATLAASACSGNPTVPSSTGSQNLDVQTPSGVVEDVDTTSILKKLKKAVVIGSTVDKSNGDKAPHAIALVPITYGLKKGQLLVCNFADTSGTAGNGTTIEVLNPAPNSTVKRFAQSAEIKGCDGDAVSPGNDVYGAGLVSGELAEFNQSGHLGKTYTGSPFEAPFSNTYVQYGHFYAPEYIYTSDAKAGSIISLDVGIASDSGGGAKPIEVVNGFDVNNLGPTGELGPSGLQFNPKNNTLYVVDGVDNTLVAISHASQLLQKDEITVKPGGKTFTCKHPTDTCATVLYSGSPLDGPEAVALLPNGNLVIANTEGGNKLVEITSTGKLLATKVVDKGKTPAVFGLLATGTDSNTVLYYTDTNSNDLIALEQ